QRSGIERLKIPGMNRITELTIHVDLLARIHQLSLKAQTVHSSWRASWPAWQWLCPPVRDRIHFVCNELSRHFLGLAIALPEKQRKIANLTQALQLVGSG